MSSDTFRSYFIFSEEKSGSEIREIIQTCFDIGCTTTDEGQSDVCSYKTQDMLLQDGNAPIKEAIDSLSEQGVGYLELWYKDVGFYLEFNKKTPFVPDLSHISLMVWESQFKVYPDSTTKEGTKQRSHHLTELINALTENTEPKYVYGLVEKYDPERVRPTATQIKNGEIDRVFWLNIFSSQIVEKLGRNRLLSAPGWKVQELPGGRVLLIVTERPRFYDQKAREIEEYLGIDD